MICPLSTKNQSCLSVTRDTTWSCTRRDQISLCQGFAKASANANQCNTERATFRGASSDHLRIISCHLGEIPWQSTFRRYRHYISTEQKDGNARERRKLSLFKCNLPATNIRFEFWDAPQRKRYSVSKDSISCGNWTDSSLVPVKPNWLDAQHSGNPNSINVCRFRFAVDLPPHEASKPLLFADKRCCSLLCRNVSLAILNADDPWKLAVFTERERASLLI